MTLAICKVRLWSGELVDLTLAKGQISSIGTADVGLEKFDAGGATVLPGLHDHHLHILATAARAGSVDLSAQRDVAGIETALAAATGTELRAVAYDERVAGLPDRIMLDCWSGNRPLRLQDRTGALWVLNSAALALLPWELPPGAERDNEGRPTGRFWREDYWLGKHWPRLLPDLSRLGAELAALGLTGLTDAGAHNGPTEAATLADAMPQRLVLMGDESLPEDGRYLRGPLKLLIDERDPPDPTTLAARIAAGREQGRAIAAHCTTAAELALYFAALNEAGGARRGDRIEHGGMISDAALGVISASPLTVVTNPGFIHDRGDRYHATVPEGEWAELYRALSITRAGVPLAAGSDAPYSSVDPWLGMRAARDRRTMDGHILSPRERLPAMAALRLYMGHPLDPGGAPRRLAIGEPADLIICEGTFADVLADLTAERVAATVIGGQLIFRRGLQEIRVTRQSL
ncbi:amidohydrolase family protein [Novosphingobium sp. Gsoil 351]|uniref:amidohydrolase family protein n=1 Tax=Novosphingobium sp. Gsoil 351 TaxID=2675225 RepID=UPI0012B4C353|nr:amidohydrolase family protein [Novosphingobium sp. Gsoil 351]QGN54177.1 amidohydrolase family protein [Novosphingobium sp. Gsoil 351]